MPVELQVRLGALARRGAGRCAYGSRVIGSTISQMSESVGTSVNGSRIAVAGSGIRSMSRLGDPLPAADRGAVEAEAVVERRLVERARSAASCAASVPSRSQNFRSTICARVSPGPLERFARRLDRPVDVVLRSLDLGHARPPPVLDHKKRPHDSEVVRPHCLGARLRGEHLGPTVARVRTNASLVLCRRSGYPERRDVAPRLTPVSARAA